MGFSANLIELRERQGISQSELARRLGTSSSIVSRWESGEYYPRKKWLDLLCDYFGVSNEQLVGDLNGELSRDESRLLDMFRQLDARGRARLIETAEDMIASGRYRKMGDSMRSEEGIA